MNTTRLLPFMAVLCMAVAPFMASAATFDAGKTVSVPSSNLVSDNAYLAGGTVTFSTTAQKDLTVAGGTVTVTGPVWGDVLGAGGDLSLLDEVRGDVRVAGGHVTIGNSVRGDLIVAGGTVLVLPGTVIGGDVVILGGAADLEGSINGQAKIYGGDITIDGTIAGPVTIKAGKAVTFGEHAVIGTSVTYSAPQEATVASGAKLGDHVTFVKNESQLSGAGIKGALFALLGFLAFAKFLAMLAGALVFVLVFGPYAHTLTVRAVDHFWKKTAVGFIALVVIPVASVLLALTMVGIYMAVFLMFAYLALLVCAGIYMGVLAGGLLSGWIKKEVRADWQWTILGTLAVFLIAFVPFIGWIADAFIFFAALGAIVLSVHRDAKEKMRS